ncbi:MAG: triose-phosphate isomerase [Coprobacter sp.]|nr:triose-phosphate isomerase [Coprobacter sp.]
MANNPGRSLWSRYILPALLIIVRIGVGAMFIFSGFVKAVDPMGMSLKIEEYLLAFGQEYFIPFSFFLSVALGAYEFTLGVNTFFGSYRKFTTWLLFLTMLGMTALTLYLALYNPVSDCGCFGAALYLTHWQSFVKNIVLLLAVVFLLRFNTRLPGIYHKEVQSLTVYFSILFVVGISMYAYYFQPLLDFRPYKEGVNIREAIAQAGEQEYLFVYERDGEEKTFAIDDLPTDTAWHYVARIEPENAVSGMENFVVYDDEGDVTDEILGDTTYTFLLMSPSLKEAASDAIDKIDELYDYTQEYGYKLYCLTASPLEEIIEWQDNTGADYPFYSMDKSVIQTIVRGNPAIVLLHDGVVVRKVRPEHLPGEAELADTIDKLSLGRLIPYTFWRPFLMIIIIFAVPMLILYLTSKTIEAYVAQARYRRLARLRKIRNALVEKKRKQKDEEQETLLNNQTIMRKNIVAGNWKMNKTLQEGLELAKGIEAALAGKKVNCDVIIGTPFIHLASVAQAIDTSKIGVAAENCADKVSGAYTGEVSAAMVASTGAEYVILGHSERRAYYHETPEILKEKVLLALANNLTPIFCIGEVLEEREADKHFDVVKAQIEESLFNLSAEEFGKIVLAYEPVWAIGTGKTATAAQAQEMHAFIRATLAAKYGEEVADNCSILYGGSCKPSNAKELFANPDVDGGLIGGAALEVESFMGIIEAFS